jgi:hypothetical protein
LRDPRPNAEGGDTKYNYQKKRTREPVGEHWTLLGCGVSASGTPLRKTGEGFRDGKDDRGATKPVRPKLNRADDNNVNCRNAVPVIFLGN